MHPPNRMEILALHGLKAGLPHFESKEEANAAVDKLLETLYDECPHLETNFPPLKVTGVPQLDRFYYVFHGGVAAFAWIPYALQMRWA
jgi:hypothetical protein